MSRKGLYRSSIKQGQTKANEQARECGESNELLSKRNVDLSSLDAEIAKLQGEANTAIQQLDLSYAQKLDGEIERLLDKKEQKKSQALTNTTIRSKKKKPNISKTEPKQSRLNLPRDLRTNSP